MLVLEEALPGLQEHQVVQRKVLVIQDQVVRIRQLDHQVHLGVRL
jgi:hypothetical protein